MLNFKQVLSLVWRDQRYRDHVVVWLGFLLLLYCYHLIFGQFFPTRNGTMGHDWSWTIPSYLIGAVPYYDPNFSFANFFSFGFGAGASPIGCHAGAGYGFSFFPHTPAPYLMLFGASPVTVAYLQFLLFASIGFWGMYVLLYQNMGLSRAMAFLGAAMFMFNGFYAHRIVIGHPYHALMLVPLLAYCLTNQAKTDGRGIRHTLLWGVFAGITAYYAYSFKVIIVIVAFMLSLLALLAISLFQRGGFVPLTLRSVIAIAVAVGLAFQSLYGMFNAHGLGIAVAQRISYSFPVFKDVGTTLHLLFEMLFLAPADIEQSYQAGILNQGILQERHELEYGITLVPLMLLLTYLISVVRKWLYTDSWVQMRLTRSQALYVAAIVLIFLFPIIYTTDFPSLLPIIKGTPLINATTSPQRTYFVFVVLIPVLAVLALSKFNLRKLAWPVTIVSLSGVVLTTVWKDREFYHNQPYDPKPIQVTHAKLKEGWKLPKIVSIGILTDGAGGLVHNQMVEAHMFLEGVQHMGCYIPGYSSVPIEYIGTLHPGSIWDETDGHFNIKNPACNTWPKENNCRPGDHFKVEQREWVDQYINHKNFPIEVPDKMRRAANINAIAYFAVTFYLLGVALNGFLLFCRSVKSK